MVDYVLAVPRYALAEAGLAAGLVPSDRTSAILECIAEQGDFRPRTEVERDQSLMQPIPCALVHCDERVLVLERQEKRKSSQLNKRLVLWVGGHVQIEDAMPAPDDLMRTALEREVKEELDLATGTPQLQGIVSDGRSLHFAIVYDLPADPPNGSTVVANDEFRLSRGTSPSGHFLTLEELDRRYRQLEPWSRIILADILMRRSRLHLAAKDRLQLRFDQGGLVPAFFARPN